MSELVVNHLKQLCHDNGLSWHHKGNGHYHIIGPKQILVNYYPYSKRSTAYVAGSPSGLSGCTPERVVALALGEE